jgi:branched-chain amino acid transport system substrate-binding protein
MKSKKIIPMLGAISALLSFNALADINVGVLVGATGPAAAIGIPSRNVFAILPPTLGGVKVNYIILDDGGDATNAVKNFRKVATENRVDLVIGPSTTPTALAAAAIASELQIPQISLSPLPPSLNSAPWTYQVAQPLSIMMRPVVAHMKANNIKTVGFIGYNDALGDVVLQAFNAYAPAAGISLVASERYARTDTNVTGQVLKIVAARPDAVQISGSGTPATLPQLALAARGFKGNVYHNHAVLNNDFLRVGGKEVEGAIAPSGPVMVAEFLPDSNPIKKVATTFITKYEGKYGAGSRDPYAAYAYDAYLIADRAVNTAKASAQPGTPAFREALRKAIETNKEVIGTHAVYNMTPTDHIGVDARAAVLVRVQGGKWVLLKE